MGGETIAISVAFWTSSEAFNKMPFHNKRSCFSQNTKIPFYLKRFKMDGVQVIFTCVHNVYSLRLLC